MIIIYEDSRVAAFELRIQRIEVLCRDTRGRLYVAVDGVHLVPLQIAPGFYYINA